MTDGEVASSEMGGLIVQGGGYSLFPHRVGAGRRVMSRGLAFTKIHLDPDERREFEIESLWNNCFSKGADVWNRD